MIRGADEGYVDDSASFPATRSPSPFSPSPAQIAGFTPDQVGSCSDHHRGLSNIKALMHFLLKSLRKHFSGACSVASAETFVLAAKGDPQPEVLKASR